MNPIQLSEIENFVNENIVDFHLRKIKSLEELKLEKLLTKNPYLFRAKNVTTAAELITGLLDAFLSSSEEKLFGDFLEALAIYIAGITCNGHKSSASGIDLEFFNDSIHYLVSIKSGTNWGNSSQHKKLDDDFTNAVIRVKQLNRNANIQPVLGICYGKVRTTYHKQYLKIVGQNFWYLISENKNLYTDIIEPIGYRAKEHNDSFLKNKGKIINRFTKQFIDRFCSEDGAINWNKLVEFNSGNFDPDNQLQPKTS